MMLEDSSDRIERFVKAIRRIDPSMPLKVWRNAFEMIREIEPYLSEAKLISLDHDLEPLPDDPPDLGDGVIVAKALAAFKQPCEVIIHSSNVARSGWMAGEFELAGWSYRRVAPIGERWIEEYWRPIAREVLISASHKKPVVRSDRLP